MIYDSLSAEGKDRCPWISASHFLIGLLENEKLIVPNSLRGGKIKGKIRQGVSIDQKQN